MATTSGDWRVEAVSNCVRVVTGTGKGKIILARLAPKQLSEAETADNAALMALAPKLAQAVVVMAESGVVGGENHPVDFCGCGGCYVRRLAARAKTLTL